MITGREYIAQDILNDKGYVIGHACREDIVRCKDCKYAPKCYGDIIHRSKGGGNIYKPLGSNGYCSHGERKEE